MYLDSKNRQKYLLDLWEITDCLEFIVDLLNEKGRFDFKDSIFDRIFSYCRFSVNKKTRFFISEDFNSSDSYHIYIKFDDYPNYLINVFFENGLVFMKKYLNDNQEEINRKESLNAILLQIENFLLRHD